MYRLLSLCFLVSIGLSSCTSNFNGLQSNGFYSKGVIGTDGKNHPVKGYDSEDVTIFYLVRHAEKASGPDPELTAEGTARANKIGEMMKGVNLDEVYSTNFKRTKNTAAPTAQIQGKDINIYNHKKLKTLVDDLKPQVGKKFLIVGHSNTTPDLLNLFQSEKVYEHIDEKIYDNFYVVILNKNKKAKILELKY